MNEKTPVNPPQPPPLAAVTVDGRELQLPKGKNLLQALLDAGIYVPHYCYHPALSIAGNCRLCLVEIEGRPKPEVSCNMTVTDGLKISVNSALVQDCRKGMMEFLLVNHPLDCPICDRGGECMLQRYSMRYGWGTARTADERRRFQKPQLDPLIDIERNRCIMCTRCVRFCDEVAGEHVLGVFGHGNRNYIGTFGDGPVASLFSGNVIDLCPVGCLTSKPFRFAARVWELRQTLTTTRSCNGAVTAWTRDGRLYRVTPPVRKYAEGATVDEDTTRFLSNEARFGSMHANSPERLLEPQRRDADGALIKAAWPEALEAAAQALREAGPEGACLLAGERSTNEEFYLLRRLADACNTQNFDWRMRFVTDAAAQAASIALAAGDADLDLLEQGAYGATVLINADILGSAPDLALRLREAARLKRTRLAVVGPRIEPWLEELAASACLEAPEALAGALDTLTAAIESKAAPQGYEKLFALLTANAQGVLALGLDAAGGALSPALVPSTLRLLKALGPGWRLLPLTAARNARGAAPSGMQGAASAPELLRRAARGEFKTLFLHRCDELTTHPQRELVEQALAATPNVIVTDIFPSWITARATVVLPGALFYETDGSMTDADGTLQRMQMACRPAGGAQEDWRILASLAELLGAEKKYRKIAEVFADLRARWGAPAFTLDDLALPGPGPQSPQAPHHYLNYRTRPDYKLNNSAIEDFSNLQSPIAETALDSIRNPQSVIRNSLRLLWAHHVWGEDHLTSRAAGYIELMPRPALELHPDDARRLGLAEGDWAALDDPGSNADTASPRRACPVTLNPLLSPGCAFGAANALGLRLGADAPGLPIITLTKTEAPAAAAPKEEVTATR